MNRFVYSLSCKAWVGLFSTIMSTASVKATSIDFTYTGSVTYYTVTTTGIYDVTAYGGQGVLIRAPSPTPAASAAKPAGNFS